MRYSDNVQLINELRRGKTKRRYETMLYPTIPISDKDTYIISTAGARCDNLAYEYYRDQRLWWVISRANDLPVGAFMIPPARRIRIPDINSFQIKTLIQDNQY